MNMDYETIVTLPRKNKIIAFFLKNGSSLNYENIVDVEVCYSSDKTTSDNQCNHEWGSEEYENSIKSHYICNKCGDKL